MQKQAAEFWKWMRIIRYFESSAKELYRAGGIKGALHLSIGQEAVPVGVCAALRDDDKVLSTHRSHGHYIGKTHDVDGAYAELLGKATGCSRGFGGSMHMFNQAKGFLGSNGIVGAGIPLALGAAFAHKYLKTDGVGATFFGDGAANQGTLHETLNLAALKKLPFLAVCENNTVAATTLTGNSTANQDRTLLAAAYGIPAITADGNDVTAVYKAACTAVEHIRSGQGPFLLDLRTYRVEPHCGIIRDTRDKSIRDYYVNEHDPLKMLEGKYPKVFTAAKLAALDKECCQIVDNAQKKALAAPMPDLEQFKLDFGV
ncbi:MAG: thiamine pyrophosphate-dependent dehydrogenase E1 component subunit alpha [Lentisphaerae bacterium]|nr:thiamine pyrophosphate-dependent dehydrogenase E1 component subunit alpha [Lentisphaerota bacterium]